MEAAAGLSAAVAAGSVPDVAAAGADLGEVVDDAAGVDGKVKEHRRSGRPSPRHTAQVGKCSSGRIPRTLRSELLRSFPLPLDIERRDRQVHPGAADAVSGSQLLRSGAAAAVGPCRRRDWTGTGEDDAPEESALPVCSDSLGHWKSWNWIRCRRC